MVMEHLRYLGLRPRLSLCERFALLLNIKINFDDPIEPHRGVMGYLHPQALTFLGGLCVRCGLIIIKIDFDDPIEPHFGAMEY